MRILIVDDKNENLYLLETLLKGNGYEVVSAANGAEALDKLRAQKFDMVIADILMPVMDGFQLCRQVKADDELKDISFVFYTAAYTDEEDEKFALELGADRFIRKPVEPDAFMKIIEGVISDVEKGKLAGWKPGLEKVEVFERYSEWLVKKLEKKMLDMERATTERVRAEESLLERESILRSFFDSAPMMMGIVDVFENDIRNVADNAAVGRFWGVDPELLRGKFASEYDTPQEYVQRWISYYREAERTGKPVRFDYRHETPNGPRWLSATINFISQISEEQIRCSYIIEDITERVRVTERLRESEERYRGLVESSPDAIFVVQHGQIVYVNPAGLRLCGHDTVSEVEGKTLNQLFVENGNNLVEVLTRLETTPPIQGESLFVEGKCRRKDRVLRDVEVTFINTIYQGGPAIQGIARDITETKQLREQAQRAERLVELGQFATTIAHEIRNPLGAIRLNFQTLSNQLVIPDDYQEIFADINLGIQRIQQTITGILDFARPSLPSLKKEDIHQVLNSSLRSVENEFQNAGIAIIKNYEATQTSVFIDANQMTQVFVNLFLNAKQAMSSGGQLTIHTTDDESSIEVHIEDTGTGIPPDDLAKIFDPFFTTKADGIGLGLAVVLRILEEHQCQISTESQVGVGTKMTLRFPMQIEREYDAKHTP